MTRKTVNDKFEEFKKKIHWFIIPLLITFFTWITVMLYDINTSVRVVQTKVEEREKSENIIWGMVKDNNEILKSKADQESNFIEHQQLFTKLEEIENKVDKINCNKYKYSYDTTTVPFKEENLTWNKE